MSPILEQSPAETELWNALVSKDVSKVSEVFNKNPKVCPDCLDKDELTPLQYACHIGHYELANLLIKRKAGVNQTKRKDSYTALMFAAIGGHTDIVRLLLMNGADPHHENCVNRNASQMAAFVGQYSCVQVITHWIPYSLIEPYTRCRELETQPRLPSTKLGELLHSYVTVPSVHPIRMILFIRDNLQLLKYAKESIYVLDNLSSKSKQTLKSNEILILKFYYSSYILEYCYKIVLEALAKANGADDKASFDECKNLKEVDFISKRLVYQKNPNKTHPCTPEVNKLIIDCIMKFPYTDLGIFKTMSFALSKSTDPSGSLCILSQMLDGPRMFGNVEEACKVCGEGNKNKKCSKCKSVYYCGLGCQRADWYQHKKLCKDPEAEPLLKN